MMRYLLLMLALFTTPVKAEDVVLGLSQNQVSITANFDGSEILIFGAVKRDGPSISDNPLHVIVAVQGPSEPLMVRRKDKRYGIWINAASVEVDSAPSYYAVATTGTFDEALNDTNDLRYKVSIPRAIRSVGAPMDVADPQSFSDAVIRIRKANQSYQLRENSVELSEETLFRTSIIMPANLTEGAYNTRIFLTRGGEVVSLHETKIDVRKVGLERWLYSLSRQKPLIYGLLSLAIAIFAGWSAAAVFSVLQRR